MNVQILLQMSHLSYDRALISAMQNYYGINDVHALTSFFKAAGLVKDDGG
ncbi:hypothetical protein NVIE_027670 [Nitrososphaera viennensis EN76]|uniref:Uncharacterized protein n=1 Tax=Nitrososphaera viennensis EN76 TaxID=926571 RepID=A0A060HNK2_9ARCH|nr:hypothetical protein NVIE_027670 [Nitrososphaera viennensis EN76]